LGKKQINSQEQYEKEQTTMMNEQPVAPSQEHTPEPMAPVPEPQLEPSVYPEKRMGLTTRHINKKAVLFILSLFLIGIVVGIILSNVFISQTNDIISQINFDIARHLYEPPYFLNESAFLQNLTTDQVILPTFGVVIVCISVLLLIGTIAVYVKIVVKTRSPYIIGLLVFLAPLLAYTIFSISALSSLFLSIVIPGVYSQIQLSIGFSFGGFGSILVIGSIFEIIGLTMLLYLSQE
jgi:hypothetical protein